MTKQIPLSRGLFSLVDDSDYEWLSQWKWAAVPSGDTFYAKRADSSLGKLFVKSILMHRQILNAPQGMEVDHIDSNGIDNRRANLRLVTRTENLRSRRTFKNSGTGLKGVTFNPQNGRWKAVINLGTYDTAEEAARAYDEAIRKLFGALAKTNFGDE